ncbi:pyrroline-5-carboxylate reductase [Sinorhizobium terangae]|uniref:Pyrroline-5-carboxylate reductase n=1 Tax=Sinorhizobium terangae TaxID=110322 RepID=A0A6N7LHD2_SINTE|nr:pyrroline-5-carboxylate reductase dimerization domain-containing protein [Sinorhizobium terangae]MBB4183402.1 pyrroline-5-carboxylate reductase [Sinorhizobium terangae]MQX17202.1 pyrroline-5-carboxylate reductase [Sinorhizobium terangae]
MSGSLRIGIVGGAGWLGGAIAASLLDAGLVQPHDLSLSYRTEQPNCFTGSFWTADNRELADRSDVIIVSVRPADWPPLLIDADGKLVISVMAGVRLSQLAEHHNTKRVVRSLPNAAAEVGKSYTPWIGSVDVTDQDRAIVRAIFDACGTENEVASESDIDYLTGLSGSGPAFPALLATAMMNDAVARGLGPEIARRAVTTVLIGAGRLLERRDEHPADTVEAFLGYRGTTAAAIEAMRAAGFEAAVADGLAAAQRKSVSMGERS